MFRWDDLGVLLAIHRRRTLAAAGQALGVDASTASRRLRALEDQVGALFDRTPDGLKPTDLARRLLPHAEQAESAVNAAAAEAEGTDVEATGVVRVALADAFAAYVVAPRVAPFLDSHPGLQLDFVVSTTLADMSRREADIAVRFIRPTTGDLVAKRIATSSGYRAVVHQSYVEAHPDFTPETLHWIGWAPSHQHLPEAKLFEQRVGRPARLVCDNLIVMVEAMLAGAGALLAPVEILSMYDDLVLVDEPPPSGNELVVWLVIHRALRGVPRIRVVAEWLEEMLRVGDADYAAEI